jgi:hypothetical protein
METFVTQVIVQSFAAAAFLTGCLFYLLPTIPAVRRFIGEA